MHLTIVSPTQGSGSAVYIYNSIGKATISNTIVVSYRVGIEARAAGATSEDYYLFYNTQTKTIGMAAGTHSVNADPQFANPAGSDYHLRPGSPAVDHGLPVGLWFDIDGNSRDGWPDIGAFELRRTFMPVVRKP